MPVRLICTLCAAAASEIQMMALPHAQYVIAEASTPASGVNSNQVKTVGEDCLIDDNKYMRLWV